MLRFMGSLRVGHDCTELNWTNPKKKKEKRTQQGCRIQDLHVKTNTWKLKRCNNEHDLKGLVGHFFTL